MKRRIRRILVMIKNSMIIAFLKRSLFLVESNLIPHNMRIHTEEPDKRNLVITHHLKPKI